MASAALDDSGHGWRMRKKSSRALVQSTTIGALKVRSSLPCTLVLATIARDILKSPSNGGTPLLQAFGLRGKVNDLLFPSVRNASCEIGTSSCLCLGLHSRVAAERTQSASKELHLAAVNASDGQRKIRSGG